MEITLRRDGRTLTVGLTPEGDAHVGAVDGASHRVAVHATSPAGPHADDLSIDIDGRRCRVTVARTRDRVLVALGGRVFTFEVGDAEGASGATGAGSGVIVAPMPGKIVAVRVTVGDVVEPGAPLVVLEAMKMESTLVSEVRGRVTAVRAAAGALVAAGEVLVEVDADPVA